MTDRWFTQPRLDLGGVSTEDIITQALDCLGGIGVAAPGDDDDVSMRGHGIDGAGYALDHLLADAAFCVVAQAAGLDAAGLRRPFDDGRFGAVSSDLRFIIAVGRTTDLPAAESLVREAIDAQAELDADLDREFQNII